MTGGLGWEGLFASPYPVMRAVFWPGVTTDMAEWARASHERGKKYNVVNRRAGGLGCRSTKAAERRMPSRRLFVRPQVRQLVPMYPHSTGQATGTLFSWTRGSRSTREATDDDPTARSPARMHWRRGFANPSFSSPTRALSRASHVSIATFPSLGTFAGGRDMR